MLTCLLIFPLSYFISPAREVTAPTWALGCILGLGVFQLAIPMILWARSLPQISLLLAAFMSTLIAVWAPIWTYVILSEPFPGALTLIGAVIIHFAVLIAALRRVKALT